MAHPKHRTSKQRRNKRRTHDAITVTAIAKCSNCGAAVQYHTVCPECGYYRGKLAIEKAVVAVSYTHLDVYKRQFIWFKFISKH